MPRKQSKTSDTPQEIYARKRAMRRSRKRKPAKHFYHHWIAYPYGAYFNPYYYTGGYYGAFPVGGSISTRYLTPYVAPYSAYHLRGAEDDALLYRCMWDVGYKPALCDRVLDFHAYRSWLNPYVGGY